MHTLHEADVVTELWRPIGAMNCSCDRGVVFLGDDIISLDCSLFMFSFTVTLSFDSEKGIVLSFAR